MPTTDELVDNLFDETDETDETESTAEQTASLAAKPADVELPDTEVEIEEDESDSKVVPAGVVAEQRRKTREERERREAAEARIAKLEEENAEAMRLARDVLESRKQESAKPKESDEPDDGPKAPKAADYEMGEDDPAYRFDMMVHRQDLLERRNAALEAKAKQFEEQELGRGHQTDRNTKIQRGEQAFMADHADYPDALAYHRERLTAILKPQVKAMITAGHIKAGQEQDYISNALLHAESQMADNALSLGVNPAAFLYETAEAMGYAPKEKAVTNTPGAEELAQKALLEARTTSPGGGGDAHTDSDDPPVSEMESILGELRKELH